MKVPPKIAVFGELLTPYESFEEFDTLIPCNSSIDVI
jgi:hypothetical protein